MNLSRTVGQRSTTAGRRFRRRSRILALPFASLLLLSLPAAAAEITWLTGSGIGNWSIASNWWPNQLPAAGDLVWVKATGGNTLWVYYASSTSPAIGTAHFDSTGGAAVGGVFVSRDILRVAQQNVGLTGRGAMAVSGTGVHQVGDLNLGFWGGSEGTYDLSGGGTLNANKMMVGFGGKGTVHHFGGTANVAGNVILGSLGGASGTYELDAPAVLNAVNVSVADFGVGVMRHSGAALSLPGNLSVGVFGGSNGRYELRGGGSIAAAAVTVGGFGVGRFVHEDGDVWAGGDCIVAFLGNSYGNYDLSGPSTLDCRNLIVGGTGRADYLQTDGLASARADVIVGNLGGANGDLELAGGDLASNRAYIGSFGRGHVEHTAGRNDVAGLMQIGIWGGGVGSYALSGSGDLEVGTLVLGGFGWGSFTQTGGTAVVIGEVRIAELANTTATLNLSGGSFSAASLWNKPTGTLNYTGGDLDADSYTNGGVFRIGGVGLRTVAGPVTNTPNGRVVVEEAAVEFIDPFIHRGQYTSTLSEQSFTNLTVEQGGIVVADAGSRFVVSGDLKLVLAGAAWDTRLAELSFVASGSGTHVLRHPGVDLGAEVEGYVDNFAWGRLHLESGEALTIEGGTLYVDVVDLEDGVAQLASVNSNGHNVYYNPSAIDNGYLGGEPHSLAGGGELIPVPEPGVVVGLLAGVGLLGGLARRRGPRVA